jgi:hypothetical protein
MAATSGAVVVSNSSSTGDNSADNNATAQAVETTIGGDTTVNEEEVTPSSNVPSSSTSTTTTTNDSNNNTIDDRPPIADAGEDVSVDERTKGFNLDATGSTNEDGTITSYIWTQKDGPEVVLDTESNLGYAVFDVPETEEDTKLTFELTVEDNKGAKSKPDKV